LASPAPEFRIGLWSIAAAAGTPECAIVRAERFSERAIFEAAIDIRAPEERASYLERVCGDDSVLRKDVEDLLAAHERLGSVAPDASDDRPSVIEESGTSIGRYQLLQEIGEGGFGVVFRAEQTDPVRRKVAVKIIKPGMDTRQVVARFEAERQALAIMDHSNIAKVFDAGTAPSGRPYFVMELVEGVPITEYCDRNRLTLRQRLDLFVSVCQAVQHAHQKGVIHRDLKPSNVLVTVHETTPVVKVIDFGLAKAMGQESLTDKTLLTGSGQMIGTPLYMSPEQAGLGGLDIDTRCDIYSLGVLLYELLTGTTPFEKDRLRSVQYDELRRIIREEDPPKPSTRLSATRRVATKVSDPSGGDPWRLSQLCRGELDWIVMKALEKDRNRRYETASALAADVDRFLCDEPVQACPPSTWYRFRKFARRHQRALAAATALVVASIAVAGSVGWIASERTTQEAALEAEVDRAVSEAGSLIASARWPEATVRVQRARDVLLTAGRRQLPRRLEEVDRDLTMAQQLEEIYCRPRNHDFFSGKDQDLLYAVAFKEYGIDVAVLPVVEASRRIRQRSIRAQLVLALDLWANMRYRAGTRVEDWRRLLEIAQAADDDPWRRQLRDNCRLADRSRDREAVAALVAAADLTQMPPASLYLLARVCQAYLQDPEKSLAVLRQAQERYPGDLWLNFTLASTCEDAHPPRYDEAVRYYSIALALRPNNPYFLCFLGRAWLAKGDYPEAIAALSQAVALKRDYADALWSRGMGYLKSEAPEKALADLSRVVELLPQSAAAWRERGVVYDRLNQWTMAAADYSEAIRRDPKDMWSWDHRAHVRVRLHDWDGALGDFSETLRLDPKRALNWMNRGEVFAERAQWAKARADFEKALELDPDGVMGWFCSACLYVQCADLDAYRRLCRRMLDRFGQSKNIGDLAIVAHARALAEQPNGERASVRQLAQLRMELSDVISSEPGYRAMSRHVLALACYRIGEYNEAVTILERADQTDQHSLRDIDRCLVLAMSHFRLSHVAEARQWLGRGTRLVEQEASSMPKGAFAPAGRAWWDWLCVQMLRQEAEALLGNSEGPDRTKSKS
jgi:serine/threonine-protein kinase